MIQDFLETYSQASNLDEKQYDCYFPQGVKRADFILFDEQVICEVKKCQSIEIQNKVEKLSGKDNLSEQSLKRDLFNSINIALSEANKQIESSRKSLNHPDALGLVILENLMPRDLSVLSLVGVANRKMLRGLINVDCVLCIDFTNTFSNAEGNPIKFAQTLARDNERSKKLCELLNQLMSDLCQQSGTPFLDGFDIESGSETWSVNQHGKYRTYKARVDFKAPESGVELNWKQQLAQLIAKWWWVIPLPAIIYDLFVR